MVENEREVRDFGWILDMDKSRTPESIVSNLIVSFKVQNVIKTAEALVQDFCKRVRTWDELKHKIENTDLLQPDSLFDLMDALNDLHILSVGEDDQT